MTTVRVGVVGVGKMGERHCRVYSGLRGATLVGLADRSAQRAREVAKLHQTKYFPAYADLLREVDAVSIATTTPCHYELTLQALEQGVHVLIEKPITQTIAEGERIVAEAEQRGLVAQMGHIERFNPAYQELKNVIHDLREVGTQIIAVNLRRLSPFDTSNVDVDVIKDLMIHDIDLVVDLCGNGLEDVSAWGRSISTDAVDHAVANLSFRNGPIATLCASRITEQKVRAVEVIADGAYIEADLLGKNLTIHRRTLPKYDKAKYRQESVIELIHVPMDEPLMVELRHFVECVHGEQPCRVPASEGLYALQIAQAVADRVDHWSRSDRSEPAEHRRAANE